MKNLITIITLAIGTLTVLPSEAQAAPSRSHSSDSGGSVEYRKVRRIVGYTRRGHRPIYAWRTIIIHHKSYKHHRRHRR
jgi:hypothetical protein